MFVRILLREAGRGSLRRWRGGGGVILGLALFFCRLPAGAQIQDRPAEHLKEAGALSEAGRGEALGTLINAGNAARYKQIILPELYGEVRAGKMEMDAVRRLPYQWDLEQGWQVASALPAKAMDAQGALTSVIRLNRGFLWGDRDHLAREKSIRRLAHKLLWNVHSNFWSQRIIDLDFSLKDSSAEGAGREWRGELWRVYPTAVVPDDKTGQLFREIVRIKHPVALNRYAWLTFRFLAADEDVVYIFSPAIEKVRELSASNRSDGFAATAVSVDDFLVWSGKPSLLEAVDLKRITGLAPFAGAEQVQAAVEDGNCVVINGGGAPSVPPQVLEGRAELLRPERRILYAPRDLWRLELVSSDPFSLYGRQVLYVDTESMLPVYKFVYDQAGAFWKSVIGAIGLAEGRDRIKYPFISEQIISDHKSGKTWLLDYSTVRYCSQFPPDMALTMFQPGKLGGQ